MTLYEYKCPAHPAVRKDSTTRADRIDLYCDFCQAVREFRRVFGFSHKPGMEEHFNQSVGRPISSMQQYKDALKHASDEMARDKVFQTVEGEHVRVQGIETNYQPLEWGDHAAFGATAEGIYESNRERSRLGMPLLPEIN